MKNIVTTMRKILVCFLAWIGGQPCLWGQCSLNTPNNCPTNGIYAGPPTLQAFLTGTASSFAGLRAWTAPQPQPQVRLSAQVIPVVPTYIQSDPHTCPTSGVCVYSNVAAIEGYIDSLTNPYPQGAGLKSTDWNIWLGPLFVSPEYTANCARYGTCYTPATNASWYTRNLALYDAIIPYAISKGVQIHMAPAASGDLLSQCGISQGSGNFTEAQVESCTVPLFVALVKRYHVDYLSLLHEPCGLMALVFGTSGCFLSVPDTETLMRHTATAVRAGTQNSGIRLGAGAVMADDSGDTPNHNCASPGPGSYWCDWVNNLMAGSGSNNVLDYAAVHVYPNEQGSAAQYFSATGGVLYEYGQMIDQVPGSKEKWADESSSLRWGNGIGDAGTFLGCGASEWLADGTFAAWANLVPGGWARAHNLTGFSLFSSEPLIYVSADNNNTHCTAGMDNYEPTVMSQTGRISQAGLIYGFVAQGWNAALEGKARLTGRTRLGH